MLTAADLIQALQRRLLLQAPHRHRAVGEFPPGWQAWLAEMAQRPGRLAGVPPQAMVDVLVQRSPRPAPKRVGDMTRWQAFAAMWRQQWHAPIPEERGLRRFAVAMTALIHLVLGVMLFWLALLQFLGVPVTREGETVVQIEYIGDGTPEVAGGGEAPPAAEEAPSADAAARAPQPPSSAGAPSRPAPGDTAQAMPDLQAPLPEIAQRDVPEPQVPAASEPLVDQPVAVSEPRNEEPVTFVLPPPTIRPRSTDPAAPDLSVPTPAVTAREVSEPVQPIQRELAPQPLANPALAARAPSVSERAIPEPLQRPSVPARSVATAPIATPDLSAAVPQVRRVDVPSPQPRPGSAAPTSAPAPSSTASTRAPASSAAPAAGRTATSSATSPSGASARPNAAGRAGEVGVGPRSVPAPGAWPTPRRADDWGDADRNRPGAQAGGRPGLYNPDGSLRVPGPPGSASRGQPPGTVTDEIADLDRAGTWLKRRPNDYEPTRFEQYWRPHQDLLEEWVSKGIKKVMVPIPGTNKKLECVVSLLQAAGGCTVSDPNLNEQPASARPPPDIPFKPELQEDNGSVKPTP